MLSEASWNQRIERAEALGAKYPFAAEILKFYAAVTRIQKALCAHWAPILDTPLAHRREPGFPVGLPLDILLTGFRPFLCEIQSIAPQPLARYAGELATREPRHLGHLLSGYWSGIHPSVDAGDAAHRFCARAFLQPYAEYLVAARDRPSPWGRSLCFFCGRKPQVAVLRPEGDGARRSLVCSFCCAEWDYRRIVCPACGEQHPERLAVYTAAEFEHVRVEACESCKTYLKTVDLTKTGRAVPVVDELATLPLNLWAQEHGYTKLESNLLGL